MIKIMRKFEKAVALVLAVILAVIIVLSTIHLASTVVTECLKQPYFLFDIHKLREFLGILISVVIAVELLDTVRVYFDESAVKIEVIFLIAMMALAREVIILDLPKIEGATLVGVAAIIAALSGGYFLIRRGAKAAGEPAAPKAEKEEAKKAS